MARTPSHRRHAGAVCALWPLAASALIVACGGDSIDSSATTLLAAADSTTTTTADPAGDTAGPTTSATPTTSTTPATVVATDTVGPPTPTPEDPMTSTPDSPVPADVIAAAVVQAAIDDLVERTGADRDAIEVVSVDEVEWTDGSLGCPQPGMSYTQALVNGTKIVLRHDGSPYDYHQGGSRPVFYCPPGKVTR